jgi:flagellar biosynthesis protein FlhB
MEIVLGFSIAAFFVIVIIDTVQQRRQNMKNLGMKTHQEH